MQCLRDAIVPHPLDRCLRHGHHEPSERREEGVGDSIWAADAGVVGAGHEEHVEVLVLPDYRLSHLRGRPPRLNIHRPARSHAAEQGRVWSRCRFINMGDEPLKNTFFYLEKNEKY